MLIIAGRPCSSTQVRTWRASGRKQSACRVQSRGPAGPRDWSRQADCFLPEARQVRTWVDEQGRPAMKMMGLDDYARDTTPFFAANAFYEVETSRRIDLFGNIAHVWSAYEARTAPGDAEPERRGINSIQLFRHPDHGWRIIHMIWDNERG
jgi:hypothetical protein